MTKRQIHKKFTNLSEKELNTRNNKKNLCLKRCHDYHY